MITFPVAALRSRKIIKDPCPALGVHLIDPIHGRTPMAWPRPNGPNGDGLVGITTLQEPLRSAPFYFSTHVPDLA